MDAGRERETHSSGLGGDTAAADRNRDPRNETGTLESLLRSCASVTERCRSYRTLTQKTGSAASREGGIDLSDDDPYADAMMQVVASSTAEDGGGGDDNRRTNDSLKLLIRQERLVAKWLERQILDKESSLADVPVSSTKPPPPGGNSDDYGNNNNMGDGILIAKERLIRDADRLDLERMLVSRMLQSKRAQQALGLVADEGAHDEASSDSNQQHNQTERQRQRQTRIAILRDGVQSRDELVARCLAMNRELESVKRQVRDADLKCRRFAEENTRRWDELKQLQRQTWQQKGDTAIIAATADDTDGSKPTAAASEARARKENTAMRRLILDLIAVCGIDWYNDTRLRDIMTRLSEEEDAED